MRRQNRVSLIALLFLAAVVPSRFSFADTVQLANGDTLTGQVQGLDDQKLKLHSELIGDVTINRDKIAAIYFGDKPPAAIAPPTAQPQPGAATVNPLPPITKDSSPEEIIKHLQGGGGIDPSSVKDLTKTFPLLAQPEVQAYFNDTVGGLVSGKLDVQDIREQAVDALDQLKDLEQDLGPGAKQALSPYKSILEKFVRETAPPEEATAPKPEGGK